MDIDKFYRVMGDIIKRGWGYYVKRPIQRFNVDNKAERVLQKQTEIPRVAPRHEGTDQIYKQISKEHPEFRKQLEERREDLLSRLKSVKVVSKETSMNEEEFRRLEEVKEKMRNRLPQSREGSTLPMYAFIEPENVPKGRVSLFAALRFIGKHTKSPEEHNAETIAKQHNMNVEDVNNIITYFKPFHEERTANSYDKNAEYISFLSLDRITGLFRPKTAQNQSIEGKSDQTSNTSKESKDSKQVDDKKD